MRRPVIGLWVCLVALFCLPTDGAIRTWDGGAGDSDWWAAANWDPDGEPLPIDELAIHAGNPSAGSSDVYAEGGGSIIIDSSAASVSIDQYLYIGNEGSGTMIVQGGGSVSGRYGIVAVEPGSDGSVTVEGSGSSWEAASSVYIGRQGIGRLQILDGGTVSANNSSLGSSKGGRGVATVSGTGSAWNNTYTLKVGGVGAGTLEVLDGGRVVSETAWVGFGPDAEGVAVVDGAGSSWTNSRQFDVGGAGSGSLSIVNGATVSGNATIGEREGSQGTVTIRGAGSTFLGSLSVGEQGQGTLDVLDGGRVTEARSLLIGASDHGRAPPASFGVVNIDGEGSIVTVDNWFEMGAHSLAHGFYTCSSGTLNVTHGGTAVLGPISKMGGSSRINIDDGRVAFGSAPGLPDGDFLLFGPQTSINSRWGATISLSGADFYNQSTSTLRGMRNLAMVFQSGPGRIDTFEIAGQDRGEGWEAFYNNATLGALQVGGGDVGRVRLVSEHDNRPDWDGPEVLYVKNLSVGAGSELDLNGHRVYCFNLANDGTITGEGSIVEVPPIVGMSVTNFTTHFEPYDGDWAGVLRLEDTVDLIVESRDGPVTYPGTSFNLHASLMEENSAGGRARGYFGDDEGWLRIQTQDGEVILLDANLLELRLDESPDQPGHWVGQGVLSIDDGLLDEACAAPFGDLIEIRLDMETPDVDDFSGPFAGTSNVVLTSVPEPGTLILLTVGGLALLARRRRGQPGRPASG